MNSTDPVHYVLPITAAVLALFYLIRKARGQTR